MINLFFLQMNAMAPPWILTTSMEHSTTHTSQQPNEELSSLLMTLYLYLVLIIHPHAGPSPLHLPLSLLPHLEHQSCLAPVPLDLMARSRETSTCLPPFLHVDRERSHNYYTEILCAPATILLMHAVHNWKHPNKNQ